MKTINPYKISFLAGLGGLLEFYDFILYMLFSDQIAKEFFGRITNHNIQNILVIALFSIAYLIRPIGGIIFGLIGDNRGRKESFSLTITIMAISIFLMAILPNYSQIGIIAPILFIVLRLIQGLAIGGELPSAIVFVYESLEKKGFALGVLFGMILCGFLLGDIMSIIFRKYFDTYAWRVAFLSGSFIAILGYFIRKHLQETILFIKLEKLDKIKILSSLKMSPLKVIAGILIIVMASYYGVFLSLFLPKYLVIHLKYNILFINKIMFFSIIIGVSFVVISSWLSDYINIYKMYTFSALLLILCSYKIFFYINSQNTLNLTIAICALSIISAIGTGLFSKIVCDLFPTQIRLTGFATCYNTSFAIIGGVVPISTEILIKKFGLIIAPTIISIIVGIICLIAIKIVKYQKATHKND
jgi:MHS family proline/betaine transporter-like MFS transporter